MRSPRISGSTRSGPARVAALSDAVVHFAAIPRILLRTDNAMFATNVLSTYNVLEAATKLGIRKVVIASSETVYGVCFADGDRDFRSFPVDEDHDVDRWDSYGLVQGGRREDSKGLRYPHGRRHLCASDRRGDRT